MIDERMPLVCGSTAVAPAMLAICHHQSGAYAFDWKDVKMSATSVLPTDKCGISAPR
jgi:hypothetical protein